MLGVWLLLWGSVALDGRAETAFLQRAHDSSGHCTYSFTVASPVEGACPEAAAGVPELRAELAALAARLSRLESRERGMGGSGPRGAEPGGARDPQQVASTARLEAAPGGSRASAEQGPSQQVTGVPCCSGRGYRAPDQGIGILEGSGPPEGGRSRQDGEGGWLSPAHAVPDPAAAPRWEPQPLAYQELQSERTEVPVSRLLEETALGRPGKEDSAGCGQLVWVGEPVVFGRADSIAGKYGVWMKDPEPVPPFTRDNTWRVDTVGTEVRQLFQYEEAEQLARGYPAKVHILPRPLESTGAVIYRGGLFFQPRHSRSVARYDLRGETITAEREIPGAGYHGQYPYSWGGYTDIDLAVDETGLWVIYSTEKARGAIVLSKLDPETLEIRRTWETNIRKRGVANSFLICGTLYTVSSYSAPNATVNFAYDTASGTSRALSIPFENRFRYLSMLDYNPAERQLFAWDSFNMVTYPVRLSRA
ncbi:MYOC protein, partial [Pachycephala philippinensis]|nr:MYOC protein [Pachycephala philippinensis]